MSGVQRVLILVLAAVALGLAGWRTAVWRDAAAKREHLGVFGHALDVVAGLAGARGSPGTPAREAVIVRG